MARSTTSTSGVWSLRSVLLATLWASCALATTAHKPHPTPARSRTAITRPFAMPTPAAGEVELLRRADEDEEPTRVSAATSSSDPTALSANPPTTTRGAMSALPSPFDTTMADGFKGKTTNNCPIFLSSVLEDPQFKKCYPISMLLQGSKSFFQASKNLVDIVRVLDAGCEADVDFCREYLTRMAQDLRKDENCASDFKKGNTIVTQAYMGLMSYEMLYAATCLKTPDTSQYCYATAVTNLTTASNVYIYFLPLNITLPGSATPTCNWCLSETMSIFQAASANRKQYIASTYESAADQVNTVCGPEYVDAVLAEASRENLAPLALPSSIATVVAVVMAMLFHL